MAKTHAPAEITVGSRQVSATAKPDVYDMRDLEYRPMLRMLPPVLDARPARGAFKVLNQTGESCTGHAIAAVINTVLARQAVELTLPAPGLVSPYMLYKMARRYDEFLGEDDLGSSLRGAFKGWLRHGVALDSQWHELASREGVDEIHANPDLDNPAFIAACRQRPLGAYYRVNAYRLDDMQSAINELRAIAVSGAIHRGWEKPVAVTPPGGGKTLMVIKRDKHATPAGGHAFCIVGYNQIGFLVQNSWGTDWGDGGFATLLYDDWLASAYDAWVCRPGVPATPLASPSVSSRVTTSGDIVLSGGPNLTLLRKYVVNTGNDGRLSSTGKFVSSLGQVDEIFENMTQKHDAWVAEATTQGRTEARHVVIYAHGGVIDETGGLAIAGHQLGWWLKSHVYPISVCWESGAVETIGDAIGDLIHRSLPFGGIRFDFEEHADRLVEWAARKFAAGLWNEMKTNALGLSADVGQDDVRGGNLVAFRLASYRHDHPDLKIHLVGHSAGTIVLAGLVRRLTALGLPIESVAFMGGAVTNEIVETNVLSAFRAQPDRGVVRQFTTFNLSEQMEQDDRCAIGANAWYHKSLLYLVAKGLEPNPGPKGFVPLVGLQVGLAEPLTGGATMGAAISDTTDVTDGRIVIAPTPDTSDLHSDAHGHADFDNDSATMTSILLRMLDLTTPPAGPYRPDVAVPDLPEAAPSEAPAGMNAHVLVATTVEAPTAPSSSAADATSDVFGTLPMGGSAAVAAGAGGGASKAKSAKPVHATPLPEIRVPTEASISPRSSSPAFDVLRANGYVFADSGSSATGNGNTPGAGKERRPRGRSKGGSRRPSDPGGRKG